MARTTVRNAQARTSVADAVSSGLRARPRTLPPWMLYDEEGSRLYERITELAEYYPMRAEREIFETHGPAMIEAASSAERGPLTVIELGAGTAEKTLILLRALVERQGRSRYVPVDVSPTALEAAVARLDQALPRVTVSPVQGSYEQAMDAMAVEGARLVLFIGSSVGNLSDDEARKLLTSLRSAVSEGDALLLGTDLRKDPSVLVPAYDDALGVTAAFNLNLLTRINRELGADFDPSQWRHVALWNDAASRIEMHLESLVAQRVNIPSLDLRVDFAEGERIHTESSVKYDDAHVDRISAPAGWRRAQRWTDAAERFAAHLLRAV